MRQKPARNPLYKLILFVIALGALYGGYHWGNKYSSYYIETKNLHLLQTPQALSPFQLTDQQNQSFSNGQLEGHWSLIFFGYSQSDGAAGEMLTLATRVFNRLADMPDLQKQMQIIFITVDPQHDTPEVLAPFVGHYSNDFIALTGEDTEIRNLANQVGAVYQRRESQQGDKIDHSTNMVLINPKAKIEGLFKGRVSAAEMAEDIKTVAGR